MVEDIATITRNEFGHYRSLVRQVHNSQIELTLFGLAAVMGPMVTGVSVALAKYPQDAQSLFYAGAALTAIACYKAVKHGREYRTLQGELTTLESQYDST